MIDAPHITPPATALSIAEATGPITEIWAKTPPRPAGLIWLDDRTESHPRRDGEGRMKFDEEGRWLWLYCNPPAEVRALRTLLWESDGYLKVIAWVDGTRTLWLSGGHILGSCAIAREVKS